MKDQQKLTPKYWVGHDQRTDDVFIETMFKHRADTCDAMALKFGADWEEQPHFAVELFEVKKVQL